MSIEDNFDYDHGWGNTFTDWGCSLLKQNVTFENGKVVITPKREYNIGWRYVDDVIEHFPKQYTSGCIITKEQFLFGEFEGTFTLPDFLGSFPGFWLYPQSNETYLPRPENYDEIDIFEQFRTDNFLTRFRVQSGILIKRPEDKEQRGYGKRHWRLSTYYKKPVTFKLIWKSDYIIIYIDNKLVRYIVDKDIICQNPMNILVTLYMYKKVNDSKLAPLILHSLKYNGTSLI